MTPEIALKNLDEVAANFPGTRAQHTILINSLQLLREIISPKPAPAPEAPAPASAPDLAIV